MEKAQADASLLNDKVGQQAGEAPVDPNIDGPRRRTWEGYAADYHGLSEQLVAVMAQVKASEDKLAAKDGELARVKAQRVKDLDRLAAVSRTRDLLEKRSSAQMAKVAAALSRGSSDPAETSGEGGNGTPSGSQVNPLESAEATPAAQREPSMALAAVLDGAREQKLSWTERRWWNDTIRTAQRSHRAGRLDDARATFEVALRTRQTASLWEQLGHVLRENSQFDEALQAYGRALTMRPGNAELMFLTGYCLEMTGRSAEAIEHYREALATDPDLEDRYDHLRDFEARLER